MLSNRQELGDFSSVVCLKAMISGMEEALGDKATAIALISAGRQRGKDLAESLDLVSKNIPVAQLPAALTAVLGKDGTRLCVVDEVTETSDGYVVKTHDTVCSAGEPAGSTRECTFTLGAIQGVLEVLGGKRLRGKNTESVLRGGSHDVFTFTVLG